MTGRRWRRLGPAGAIRIRAVWREDGRRPRDRLYEVEVLYGKGEWQMAAGLLGSEIADLARWWKTEAKRRDRRG